MAVRSKRLWSGVLVGTASVQLYAAQSGETTLIKTLTFHNQSATTSTVRLTYTNVVGGAHQFIAVTVAPGAVEVRDVWFVVPSLAQVYASASVASSIRCGGHGAELEGVPD